MGSTQLPGLINSKTWTRCQIYGVLPDRHIRIHLAGLIQDVSPWEYAR